MPQVVWKSKYGPDKGREWTIDNGELVLPPGLTKMPNHAFYECKEVRVADLGSSVEIIEVQAFRSSSVEKAMALSVRTVEGAAFIYTSKLARIVFGRGLQEIGVNAFYNCPRLKRVVVPASAVLKKDLSVRGPFDDDCEVCRESEHEAGQGGSRGEGVPWGDRTVRGLAASSGGPMEGSQKVGVPWRERSHGGRGLMEGGGHEGDMTYRGERWSRW